MSVGLGWLGIGVGAIGSAWLFVLGCRGKSDNPSDAERQSEWLYAAVALAITLIFWAIGIRIEPPGLSLAWGWLIGGVAGAIAIIISNRLNWAIQNAPIRIKRLASLSILFYGLLATSLVYILFPHEPVNALIGFAIGAIMAAILQGGLLSSTNAAVRVEDWAIFSITLAAAIVFSVMHFEDAQYKNWWSIPILLATSVLLASYVSIELTTNSSLRDKPGRSYPIGVLISAIIVAGLTALYSWKIVGTMQLLGVVAVGLVIGAAIGWLAASIQTPESRTQASALCVVLLVALPTASFKLWGGLGVALGLLAAWTVLVPVLCEQGSEQALGLVRHLLRLALCLGLAMLLYRLFTVQYAGELRRIGLQTHYTFIGALLGIVLPFVIVDWATTLRGPASTIFRLLFTGIVAAAAPLAVFLLWQTTAVLGFVFGLTAALAFTMLSRRSERDDIFPIGLLAIGAQLVAIQFIAPLMEADMVRLTRVYVLVGLLIATIAWICATTQINKRTSRTEG